MTTHKDQTKEKDKKEKDNAVIRACKIIKILAGKSLQGMQLKDIATAIGDGSDNGKTNAHRSLKDLQKVGFVTQFDNKRYALSTAMMGIAQSYQLEMAQAQERITNINQRVTANAHQYL